MDKQELKDYLKNNLYLSINKEYERDYGNVYHVVTVTLSIEGETISEEVITI